MTTTTETKHTAGPWRRKKYLNKNTNKKEKDNMSPTINEAFNITLALTLSTLITTMLIVAFFTPEML